MEPENNLSTADNGKNVGIVSYITFIGWLIAYFSMHQNNKTELGSYQLRQTLLFYIICFAFYILWGVILVPILFTTSLSLLRIAAILSDVVYIVIIVFWVIGFIGAVNGQKKPMPFIGDMAQKMFPNI